MKKLPKLDIISPEELLKNKQVDKEFLSIYITERDKCYNKLIDEVNRLNGENKRLREEYVMLQNASDLIEDELKEKIKLLNKMNEKNYNNYCKVLKENKKLKEKGRCEYHERVIK